MCRLYGFRANEPTKVECSLIHAQNALLLQSRQDMLGRAHADGWGLASYSDTEIHLEHRASAAYEGVHFSEAAERIYATTVLAHVRRATVGTVSTENTHPFRYRRWTFVHNGTVTGFDHIGPALEEQTDAELQKLRRGTTDSEQAFLWILTRLAAAGVDLETSEPAVSAVAAVVGDAVRRLDTWARESGAPEPPKLNFILTNGPVLVASRWNHTLYLLEREGVHDCEICGIPHVAHDSDRAYRAVVVASEPITHESWREVAPGAVVGVDSRLTLSVLS